MLNTSCTTCWLEAAVDQEVYALKSQTHKENLNWLCSLFIIPKAAKRFPMDTEGITAQKVVERAIVFTVSVIAPRVKALRPDCGKFTTTSRQNHLFFRIIKGKPN